MWQRLFRVLPIVLGLAACGGGGEPDDPDNVLEVVKWTPSGENQTDTVGQTLPNVIRVKVTLDGELAAGVTVNFTGGVLGTPSMVTGSNGIATSTWTLGPEAGEQTVTVTVAGAVGSPLTFHATALPGPAVSLAMLSGNNQIGTADQTLPMQLTVKVADTFGNGIGGVWTRWHPTGGLSLAADSLITGADGIAAMFAVAGHVPGIFGATATVTGLTGSPVEFAGAVITDATNIDVQNNFFDADSILITVGTAVQWTWVGSGHSVSPTEGSAFMGTDVHTTGFVHGPLLFMTPGVYTYECSVHPSMQGKIVVQ